MKETIFISFYNSYPITSGASAVTTSYFLNWPGKKKLFQLNHYNLIKKKNIYNFKISSNHFIFKFLNLIPFALYILVNINKKKIKYIIFEGASWSGYIYILYKILSFFLKKNYIYHSHNVDFCFRKKNIIIKYLSFFFEKKILQNFDISTSVSINDQKTFKKIFDVNTVLLPNGINIEKKYLKKKKLKKYIFFSGSLEFNENRKTFNRLLTKEFEIVRKIIPDIKIYQTGGDNHKYFDYNNHVKELGNLNRKVYLKYLQEALLIIVPASSGPGTKIKVIEALCYNKYLLTSKFGMKGLKSRYNKKIIYSNLSEFKKKINFLKNHNFKLANHNKIGNFFRAHYNIKNIIRKFHENYL